MATEFQPFLQGPSASLGAVAPVAPVDYSGVFGAVSGIVDNISRNRAAAQERQNQIAVAGLTDNLLAMHEERSQGELLEQKINRDMAALEQSGLIGQKESDEYRRVASQLEQLNQWRQQGLGNDTQFRVRKVQLMRQALSDNPMIAEQVRTLFGHDISNPNESPQTLAQSQIAQNLDQRYGPNWSVNEYRAYLNEQRYLANYETNQKLGTMDVANITRSIDEIVNVGLIDWDATLKRMMDTQGALKQGDLDLLEQSLFDYQQMAAGEINRLIQTSQQNGRVLDPRDISFMQDRVTNLINVRRDMLSGKDLPGRIDAMRKVEQYAMERDMPSILRNMTNMMGGGGGSVGNLESLVSILSNDKVLEIAKRTGHPWLQHVNPEQMLGDIIEGLSLGYEFQDPTYRKIANLASSTIIRTARQGQEIDPNITGNLLDGLIEETSLDRVGVDLPSNIVDAMNIFNDPQISRNWVNNATPEQKNSAAVMIRNWASTGMAEYQAAATPQSAHDIIYNPVTRKFETTQTPKHPDFAYEGAPYYMPTVTESIAAGPANKALRVLNGTLDLARNPHLKGIALPEQQVLDMFHRSSAELIELIEQEEQREKVRREQNERLLRQAFTAPLRTLEEIRRRSQIERARESQ